MFRIAASVTAAIGCALAGFGLMVSTARATVITFGPAATPTAYGNEDGGGTRANFDYTNPVFLAAGTYTLSNFQFEASQSGNAEPVIATVLGTPGSGAETYTIIATGADTSIASSGFESIAESDSFVIPAGGETAYAGFVNSGNSTDISQAIDWAYVGSSSPGPTGGNLFGPPYAVDAHFNPGQDLLTGNNPAQVGDQFMESGGTGGGSLTSTSAYEINREYQFNISVTPVTVPEPASILLMCAALFAIGCVGRTRRGSRCCDRSRGD